MFLVVLEGMVYTVAAIFAAAALYLGKWDGLVPHCSLHLPSTEVRCSPSTLIALTFIPSLALPSLQECAGTKVKAFHS